VWLWLWLLLLGYVVSGIGNCREIPNCKLQIGFKLDVAGSQSRQPLEDWKLDNR
jgi:hypothetical protein